MRSTVTSRLKRTLTALLLMFVLSFTAVFAGTDEYNDTTPSEGKRAEAGAESGTEKTEKENIPEATKEPEHTSEGCVFQKGRFFYYKYPNGKIRKKSGFVTVGDRIYYVRRGGRVRTNTTFRVGKKYYRADKHGVILTGVYKWKGDYFYSYSRGQCRKKEGFAVWNDNVYYVEKGGRVKTDEGFIVDNTAYVAGEKGCVEDVFFPEKDNNRVIKIAREQVGIMTGKTYWVWYYRTRFRDTDRTPWCGAFVAWCYNEAGLYKKISVAKRYGPLGYVPSYSRYADSYKKWIDRKKARAGDIIVFGWNSHVGLVEGVYGDYIVTIEGNAGPTAAFGSGKPGAVVRRIHKLNSNAIKGVICVLKHKKA